MPEPIEGVSRTATIKWETKFCPRCSAPTTFYFLTDDVLTCSQCRYEEDRTRGLNLGPG